MKSVNKMLGAPIDDGRAGAVGHRCCTRPSCYAETGDSGQRQRPGQIESGAENNAKNVQKDLKGAQIEIVAYGPGIGMLKADSEVASRVGDAADSGIKVVACQNTMRVMKLSKDDMNAKIGYVNAVWWKLWIANRMVTHTCAHN